MSTADRQLAALHRIATALRGSLVNKSLLLATALVVADTFVVAHYQPATALALLRTTPPLTLLTGVMLNLAPVLLTLGVWWYACWGAVAVADRDAEQTLVRYGKSLLCLLLGALVVDEGQQVPWWGIGLVVVAGWAIGQWTSERVDRDDESWGLITVMGAVAVFVALAQPTFKDRATLDAVARPFLPVERIEILTEEAPGTADPQAPATQYEVGYVLQADEVWTTVMRHRDRSIRYVRSALVHGRTSCLAEGSGPVRPLLGLELRTADVPRCPS